MSFLEERESVTPGWEWAGFRTWRYIGPGAEELNVSAWTSELGHRYTVTKVVPMRIDHRQRRLP